MRHISDLLEKNIVFNFLTIEFNVLFSFPFLSIFGLPFEQCACLGDVLSDLLLAGATFVSLWVGEADNDRSVIPLAILYKRSLVCVTKQSNDF